MKDVEIAVIEFTLTFLNIFFISFFILRLFLFIKDLSNKRKQNGEI